MPMFASIMLAILQYGPTVLGDAEGLFDTIAKGEGGAQKMQNVVDGLSHLLGHAARASAAAAQTQPAAPAAAQTAAGDTGAVL